MTEQPQLRNPIAPTEFLLRKGWAFATATDFRLAGLLTLICFASRLVATPASFWEWDEILFARALHEFDVTKHAPHPPGFPVFILFAKLAYALTGDELRALVSLNLISASLFGAALFYCFRKVFRDRLIAFSAAFLCCFFPNIWVYSGAPRSDGPALTLGIIGVTLALRGLQSRRALLWACLVLGLGMGVRVTVAAAMGTVLAIAFLSWLRRREWKLVGAALAIIVIGILSWSLFLIIYHGWEPYREIVKAHQEFVLHSDSFLGDGPNGMWAHRIKRFFVDLWGANWIMWLVYALSAFGVIVLSAAQRWRELGLLAAAFMPYLLFSFLLNNPMQAVFYAMPFMPLFAGLSAAGVIVFSQNMIRHRVWRHLGLLPVIGAVLLIGEWTSSIVKLVHQQPSPVFQAIEYLRQRLDPNRDEVHYTGLFDPHVKYFLQNYRRQPEETIRVPEPNLLNPTFSAGRIFALTEQPVMGDQSVPFHWREGRGAYRLPRLSLGRYFNIFVTEFSTAWKSQFLTGWHDQEGDGKSSWRWMSGRGEVALFNEADEMQLRIRATAVKLPEGNRPTLTLRLDGREIARFTPEQEDFDRTFPVIVGPDRMWSVLTVESDKTVSPRALGIGTDEREMALRCYVVEWKALHERPKNRFTVNQFIGEGWHDLEQSPNRQWRWTKERATVNLPPLTGNGQLELTMCIPGHHRLGPSRIGVSVAGQRLDTFDTPDEEFTRRYTIPANLHQGKTVMLELTTNKTAQLPNQQVLGIQVFKIEWKPAGPPMENR